MTELLDALRREIESSEDPVASWNALRKWVAEASGQGDQPVAAVLFEPIEKVVANDYNPNSVAPNEMKLLYTSIAHDGYTQPVVTVYDPERDRYVIVDGFHRYTTGRRHLELLKGGLLPIVVIDKPINDRMASTVRHNRARGKHAIGGMASMVFNMLEQGWDDAAICNELGMEPDELLRLKHITGFSKLFENVEYQRAWETKKQIQLRAQHGRVEVQA